MDTFKTLKISLQRIFGHARGTSGVEYGLLLGLLVVAILAAVSNAGSSVKAVLCLVANDLNNVVGSAGSGGCNGTGSSGTGTPSLALTSPAPFTAASSGATVPTAEPVTLSNSSTTTANGLTIALADGTNFTMLSTTCGSSLAGGATCTISIQPTTPMNAGSWSDVLSVTSTNAVTASTPVNDTIGGGSVYVT